MAKSSKQDDAGKKKKRNRPVASCNPCRQRRVRCDRGRPCAACIARDDAEGCVWAADALAPLFERREANENEKLRSEVDRLQRLVDVLVSAQGPPDILTSSPSQPSDLPLPPALPLPPPPYPASSSGSPPTGTPVNVFETPPSRLQQLPEEPADEVDSHDLVRRLSELTIKTFELGGAEYAGSNSHTLVSEAQLLLDSKHSASAPLTSPSGAKGSTSFFSLFPAASTPATTKELLVRVPPKHLANKTANAYFESIAWYIHPITRHSFEQHSDAVFAAKDANEPAPAFSLAICFAVWALGLFAAEENVPVYGRYSKDNLAVAFMELAREALAIGRFLEHPTLDAIRALILVATHYAVFAPGDDGGAGIGLLALAVQGCLQLELHRDPDKRGGALSFADAEDRRRLFWMVFLKDVEIASVMGRRFTLLHLRDIDCRLPLDVDDHNLKETAPTTRTARPFGEETNMTFLLFRMKFAKIVEQITEKVFGIHAVAYSMVLDFDRQIRAVQDEFGQLLEYYKGSEDSIGKMKWLLGILAIKQELIRLHRPYLARAYIDKQYAYSRTTCVEVAREVLELQKNPLLQSSWSCMIYKAIQAAIVLAIELMYDPVEEGKADKALIESAVQRIEQFKNISTICRRGAKLLHFLLDKISSADRLPHLHDLSGPLLKRTRTAPGSMQTLPRTFGSPASAPLILGPSTSFAYEADYPSGTELWHKPTRLLPHALSLGNSAGDSAPATGHHLSPRPVASTSSFRPRTGSSVSSSSRSSLGTHGSSSSALGRSNSNRSTTSVGSTSSGVGASSSVGLDRGIGGGGGGGGGGGAAPSMQSAADEIASMDFSTLLGLDGSAAAPFSFDFSLGPAAPGWGVPVPTTAATSAAYSMLFAGPSWATHDELTPTSTFKPPQLHEGGAWDFLHPASAAYSSSLPSPPATYSTLPPSAAPMTTAGSEWSPSLKVDPGLNERAAPFDGSSRVGLESEEQWVQWAKSL